MFKIIIYYLLIIKVVCISNPETTAKELHLFNRNLTQLNSFTYNEHLETINLNHNQITVIQSDTFSHLINLKYLSLSNNQIQNLSQLNGLEKLETLFIDYNQLEKIVAYTFTNLINLKELYLNNNKLIHINKLAFYNLKKQSKI